MSNAPLENATLPDLLEELAKRLREQSQPMPADFNKFVTDQFWNLLRPPTGRPMCESCKRGGVCGCYQPQWDSPIA